MMPYESWEEWGDRKWEIHDGTSSEIEMGQMLYGLVRMLKPDLAVETGSYVGHATLWLARAIAENHRGKLISVDTDENSIEQARARCDGIAARYLEIRHGNVVGGLPELEQADFIFSDSGYEMRMKEMERAKPGAVVVVHDTAMAFDGRSPKGFLGELVRSYGGLVFKAGRGFGIIVK